MICPHCRAEHPSEVQACPATGQPMPGVILPGIVLEGKYKVVKHLASGGMGAVYQAEHTLIGKQVAIKVLHPEFAKNDDIVQRFRREARAASSIGHQHIVDIQDMGRTPEGGLFLVMELLQGMDLGDIIAKAPERKVEPLRAGTLMLQVLSALDAAHQHQIVHRDLKPENIFVLQRPGQDEFVKIVDFGISKILTDEQSLKLTSTGFVLGTPYYMAPEQARGAKVIDHRVDIYSAGTILYQAVCGRLPFLAPNFNALLFEIAAGKITPPRQLTPALDPEYERVILKAMALDQDARYRSAQEFARELQPCMHRLMAHQPARLSGSEARTVFEVDAAQALAAAGAAYPPQPTPYPQPYPQQAAYPQGGYGSPSAGMPYPAQPGPYRPQTPFPPPPYPSQPGMPPGTPYPAQGATTAMPAQSYVPGTPPPGFQSTPPPGFQSTPPPGFQSTPPPGFQSTPPPGFQPTPAPGFGTPSSPRIPTPYPAAAMPGTPPPGAYPGIAQPTPMPSATSRAAPARKSFLIPALAVGVVLGGGVAAALVLGHGKKPSTPTVTASNGKAGASQGASGGQDTPKNQPQTVTTKPGGTLAGTGQPTTPPAPKMLSLKVAVTPADAAVTIDGKPVANGASLAYAANDATSHAVVATKTGYDTLHLDFTVSRFAGQADPTLALTLVAAPRPPPGGATHHHHAQPSGPGGSIDL